MKNFAVKAFTKESVISSNKGNAKVTQNFNYLFIHFLAFNDQ